MSQQENNRESNDDNVPPWTVADSAVGDHFTRAVIKPLIVESGINNQSDNTTQHEFFQSCQETLPVALFQAKHQSSRKPTLHRTLVPRTLKSNTTTVAIAIDTVPPDSKANDKEKHTDGEQLVHPITFPSKQCVSNVQERIVNVILEEVVNKWIRHLILVAAVEECQTQFLRQFALTSQVISNPTSSGDRLSYSQNEPLYYKQSPSSYLVAPKGDISPNSDSRSRCTLPIQFSPSQLVQRIKQGCSLVWQDFERRIPLQIMMNNLSASALLERRASSRLARPTSVMNEPNDTELMLEWKLIAGGRVALFIKDNCTSLDAENQTPNQISSEINQPPRTDDSDKEVEIEETNDAIDELSRDNPYLDLKGSPIIEWMGRKTAKFLSSSDIQSFFPSLMVPKIKKSKHTEINQRNIMDDFGASIERYLSQTDRLVWNKMLESNSFALVDNGARFYFQPVNDEDTTKIQYWEISSFSRTQFTIYVWNEEAERKMAQQALEGYAAAELEYKERKSWETWRYKGIQSGYTVWPSWLKAVENWRKSQDATIEKRSPDIVGTESIQAAVSDSEDLVLAKAIAEQEAANGIGGTRRSRRSGAEGSSTAVFYGGQSNLTQKQVMEALLRITSLSTYQTLPGLATSILDTGNDPYRRVRAALGKLVWKRNQLSRFPVNTNWSDNPVWQDLMHSPLVTTAEQDSETGSSSGRKEEELNVVIEYIRDLHRSEIRLRQIVLQHLSELPASIIATAADEKVGGLESSDESYFDSDEFIEWRTSGHELVGNLIFRPSASSAINENAHCHWFKVVAFTDSVQSTPEDNDVPSDRPQIGLAKECATVKRRRRFRVCMAPNPMKVDLFETAQPTDLNDLVLTEGQVYAGRKSAEIELKRASSSLKFPDNAFTGTEFAQVTLIPPENSEYDEKCGIVVGRDYVRSIKGEFQERLLFLPRENISRNDAIWLHLSYPDDGTTECRFEGIQTVYTLQRLEYQPSSSAFKECRNVIDFMTRQSKIGPFLEPVDPIELNIPDYFDVVKSPMDVSTLSKNLEAGKYSNVQPKQTKGRSPVARMLNGPFQKDLFLIFDNAMLFNPPDDWIYQSASALKKSVSKKIGQIVDAAENSFGQRNEKSSIYVEDESDVDAYEYESDQEDDYLGSGRKNKRKRSTASAAVKEDSSTRAIERGTKLQKVLNDALGLQGSLANIPFENDTSTYSLPPGWCCRRYELVPEAVDLEENINYPELDELLLLHSSFEEQSSGTSRRSTRTQIEEKSAGKKTESNQKSPVEYYLSDPTLMEFFNKLHVNASFPRNRTELEGCRERMHEEYYAKMYFQIERYLQKTSTESFGSYAENSFPPYLGRVVPEVLGYKTDEDTEKLPIKWEIRESYRIPALRWIIRGLIKSDHLKELDVMDSSTEASSFIPNHVYYFDPSVEPFDIVDTKEASRKKKSSNGGGASSSDDEVELSEYEKMRAERVARNAERLKSLGLSNN